MLDAIRWRRKAECIWLRDQINWQKIRDFYQLRRAVSNIIHQAECEHFTNILLEHKHQPREIFRICDRLLERYQDLPLPPGYTNEELATMFNNFFITKIAKIREVLVSACMDTIQTSDCCTCVPTKLATFKVLTCQDVEIISTLLSKSCETDPITSSLLKEALPSLMGILTAIVDLSMQSSVFLESLKEALVKPLLKKITIELTNKNYRSVSNLQMYRKVDCMCVD